MRFTAINIEGKKVEGIGVAVSSEDYKNWSSKDGIDFEDYVNTYGTSLSYLFDNTIDWVDGAEFNAANFEVVWTGSVKMI